MKSFILKCINKLGYEVRRSHRFAGSYDPHTAIKLQSCRVVDLEAIAHISASIPGMISPRSGQILYTLCYMQVLQGDVVEVGSWQGRSTSFLARAVQESGNGEFYAIDHFKGNLGKEGFYVVGKSDLSDLKSNFLRNMDRIGLKQTVHLFDMPNEQAEQELGDIKIRFLFIDGDHTKAGVEKDIELFFPKLMPGSIVVFDDFSAGFPGLVEAVDRLMEKHQFARVMSYHNTLVVML